MLYVATLRGNSIFFIKKKDLDFKETHHLHQDANEVSPTLVNSIPSEQVPVLQVKRKLSTLTDSDRAASF